MNWIKYNILNILNLIVLAYALVQIFSVKAELEDLREISKKTAYETQMNNTKLDYVESDINARVFDSINKKSK